MTDEDWEEAADYTVSSSMLTMMEDAKAVWDALDGKHSGAAMTACVVTLMVILESDENPFKTQDEKERLVTAIFRKLHDLRTAGELRMKAQKAGLN